MGLASADARTSSAGVRPKAAVAAASIVSLARTGARRLS
jgi:hypothetical protein